MSLSLRAAGIAALWVIVACREPVAPASRATVAAATPAPPQDTSNTTVAAATPAPPQTSHLHTVRPELSREQSKLLHSWYDAVGSRREGESFGELIVRTARHQLQKPYDTHRQVSNEETLRIDLNRFQCVSLVESVLAVARCTWRSTRDSDCFLFDVEASRYRGGRLSDYASRLHYFPEWMRNNEERGRVKIVTGELGGELTQHTFAFMTSHISSYPPLKNNDVLNQIRATEARLSSHEWTVLNRDRVSSTESALQDGDIVALVSTKKPGLLVGHTGFVDKSPQGVPRLLHASSYHKRVLLTAGGIAAYVQRRPYRRGIMVARPLPPP